MFTSACPEEPVTEEMLMVKFGIDSKEKFRKRYFAPEKLRGIITEWILEDKMTLYGIKMSFNLSDDKFDKILSKDEVIKLRIRSLTRS